MPLYMRRDEAVAVGYGLSVRLGFRQRPALVALIHEQHLLFFAEIRIRLPKGQTILLRPILILEVLRTERIYLCFESPPSSRLH